MKKRELFSGERALRREPDLILGWDADRLEAVEQCKAVEGPKWEDIEQVWSYLQRDERILLRLMREGKTCSDIAEIMRLERRKLAHDEMVRIVRVVKFFVKWAEAIGRIDKCEFLSSRHLRILKLYVRHRMGREQIAMKLGDLKARYIPQLLRRIEVKCRDKDMCDVADMIDACLGATELRGGCRGYRKERKADMREKWRETLKKNMLGIVGKVWYEWGAQAPWRQKADCSGLIIEALKKCGVLPEGFKDVTAQGLARVFRGTTVDPKAGDLAFYGKNARRISHVMMYVGGVEHVGRWCVVGMCGGRRSMKAERARMVGAGLWVRSSSRYRRDFLFFKRVA